jgi:bleomycin hydrolase
MAWGSQCDEIFKTKYLKKIPVKDQCNWGSCWLTSTINQAQFFLNHIEGKNLVLSDTYSYMMYIKWKLQEVIESEYHEGSQIFQEGADYWTGRYILDKFGVMPKSAIKNNEQFKQKEYKKLFMADIKDVIGRYMKEKNKTTQVKKAYSAQIEEVFDKHLGKIPKSFTFEGKHYTPTSFFDEHFPKNSRYKVVEYMSVPDTYTLTPMNLRKRGVKQKVQKLDRSTDYILKTIRGEINAGKPVYLSFNTVARKTYWTKEGRRIRYFDNKRGFMTAENKVRNPDDVTGGHGVLVTGYSTDKKGAITYLQILNTWGGARRQRRLLSNGYELLS